MANLTHKVLVAGVGMVPFTKPGQGSTYDVMGAAAIAQALADANLDYGDVDQAFAGYVYADSCAGQRVVYQAGMTGIPVFNVNNNCASGSSALFLARQAILGGLAHCVLAVGFEQMDPGSLPIAFPGKPNPFIEFDKVCDAQVDIALPHALRYFGGAGRDHMDRHGTSLEDFARVRAKASRHAMNNPYAVFRNEMTVEDVLAAPMLWPGVMTKPMACPSTSGAAAVILVSAEFARRRRLDPSVSIAAQAMVTDTPATLDGSMEALVGSKMTQAASRAVYEESGVGPQDIKVVELHDCFAHNEVISYEGLGLCRTGEAAKFIADGDNTYGGRVVTNPSGGLLSKGHPLGATGLAQCVELTHQLRGSAGPRQVEGARHALQHNLGLGGACVVTLYEAG